MEEKKSSSFFDYLKVIIKWRRFIIKAFLIVAVAALIISLIIPPMYTATATILPPNLQQEAIFGLLQSSVLGGFSSLSGLGGMLPGASTPSDLFAAILGSERIMGKVIQQYDLKKIFRKKTMEDAFKTLKGITNIGVSPEGIVSVSVTWYDKKLAADIANSFVGELDKFNTETAMTTGKKYRIFIERRLKDNKDTLAQAEEALRNFQEKNRTIILDEEIKSVIVNIAALKSQIILLEVKKGVLSSSAQFNNPYFQEINKELEEMKGQLAKIEFGDNGENKKTFGAGFSIPFSRLPKAVSEYLRLLRDVKVQEVIFEILTQQYEQAKIMELKDTPTVQVLDRATPPERKSSPQRARIVLLASILSLILGIISSFFLEYFEQLKKSPEEYKKFSMLYEKIKNDFQNTKDWFSKHILKIIFTKK